MEISTRALWTLIHGMGFAALYLLACSGALFELYRLASGPKTIDTVAGRQRLLNSYFVTMAVLAWAAVLTGAYLVYPWYRAAAPAGAADLSAYPQRLLLAKASTAGWHTLGMEWKEHVAWFAPISITMVAVVVIRYGRDLRNHAHLRAALLCFTAASFLAAGIAGFFGAMIDKVAPVQGGRVIQIQAGGER